MLFLCYHSVLGGQVGQPVPSVRAPLSQTQDQGYLEDPAHREMRE